MKVQKRACMLLSLSLPCARPFVFSQVAVYSIAILSILFRVSISLLCALYKKFFVFISLNSYCQFVKQIATIFTFLIWVYFCDFNHQGSYSSYLKTLLTQKMKWGQFVIFSRVLGMYITFIISYFHLEIRTFSNTIFLYDYKRFWEYVCLKFTAIPREGYCS